MVWPDAWNTQWHQAYCEKDLRSLLKDYTKVTRLTSTCYSWNLCGLYERLRIFKHVYITGTIYETYKHILTGNSFHHEVRKKQFGYSSIFLDGCQRWCPVVYLNPQWIIGYLPGFSLLFTHLKTKSIKLIGKSSSMPKGISFHWSSFKVWKTVESYLRCIFMYQWNQQHYYPCIHSTGLRNVLNESKSSQKVYAVMRNNLIIIYNHHR